MKNILLLTATIRPKPQPELAVADPGERLNDYLRALEFYVTLLSAGVLERIVFIDNSGYDLRPLAERCPSEQIEFLTFYDLDYPVTFHRGYGEFRLVDTAFTRSATLSALEKTDMVWKVTGRYIVKNLARVIRLAPKEADLYCKVKKERWVEMSLMAWSRRGYEAIIKDVWQEFASGTIPELILARKLEQFTTATCRIVTTYYWPPFIIGRRGANAVPYQGRFTPVKFAFTSLWKLAALPFRKYR